MVSQSHRKFVIIFGPPAVGKMTVGFELAKRTGLKLFHNHMTIDLALNFFDFEQPPFQRLVGEFRKRIFEEVAASELPGLIFTYVWVLDSDSEKKFIDGICEIFHTKGALIYFVELEADLTARVHRNETEFRLSQKPSKRDVKKSRERLLGVEEQYKLNSDDDFFYQDNYMKINNTNLIAVEVAQKIIETFHFPTV